MTATMSLTLNDQALRDALAQSADALGDLTQLMDEIGAALVDVVRGHFEAGEAPDGRGWLRSRAARERSGQTLLKDGHLRDSITYEATSTSVEVGTNLIYAAIHQFGGTIKPVNAAALKFKLPNGAWVTAAQVTLPARPYLGIGQNERIEITEVVEAYVTRAFAP